MSTYFRWIESMSVGESDIDKQHQRLLSQVNKIEDAISFGATSKEVAEALEFFDKYIQEHFSYEESYMKEHNYPYLEEHKKEHENFIKNNSLFKEALKRGLNPRELILDVETYLGQWWMKHICKVDKKYHDFISELE
ncbi:hemerythrin family protein [Candidatus Nomurabacteria bacterium]|nr:hemerythrin family protein [Candidatus Nomurabacteria bacterium]